MMTKHHSRQQLQQQQQLSRLLVVVLFYVCCCCCCDNAEAVEETYTSGVWSAWMGDGDNVFKLSGDINVFLTDKAFEHEAFGMSGAVFGLPPPPPAVNSSSSSSEVRIVMHASGGSCDNPGPAMEFSGRQALNRTLAMIDGVGYLEVHEKFDPAIFNEESIEFNPVAVYLPNGTRAGCGVLLPVPDSAILEAQLNAFTGGPRFQSEITMVATPDYPVVCFFGTAVGMEPNIEEQEVCGRDSGVGPTNKCGLQVRQQSGCEEDAMEPTIFNPSLSYDPWTWSRYFWSNAAGFTFFSQCVNLGWEEKDTIDRLAGNSFLAYNSEGVALGCGQVNYYEPPAAAVFQSNVFQSFLRDNPDTEDAHGFIYVFQNTEAIRNGVMGVTGYGLYEYRPELRQCQDASGTCQLVVFHKDTTECGDDTTMGDADAVVVGALEFDTEGGFFGILDVVKEDMEKWIAGIRLPDGTFATCDTLEEVPDSIVYQTKTEPYPGRSETADIVSALAFDDELCSFGVVYGLAPNIKDCSGGCLYHVNEGTSCDEPNGHLFNSLYLDESPWQESRYSQSDEYGVAFLGGCVATEIDNLDFEGHAMVIRGPDNLPASCGILRAFEPLVDNGVCNICPLDGYEFTKPDELLNFGGSVDVSCADMKKNVESFRSSTEQCVDVQQVTSRACGCAHQGTILESPKSSKNSSPIIIGAIAAIVIVGLGVAVFLFSRRKSAGKTPHSTIGDLMLEQQQQQIGHGQDHGTQRISESLVSQAPAVATAVHDEAVGRRTSNAALTSKNQLLGESFWQDRDADETPYARVVSVESSVPEDSMAGVKMMDSETKDKRQDSESSC